ncbi:MAG: response regulator [bacterium]
MNIIVLDDHKQFREQIVATLNRNGHAACGIEKAVDALPLAESGSFDYTLVDFNMPDHDGLWFMRNLKRPLRTKPILVTAHVNRQVIDAMFKLGIRGYLIKPFSEDDLIRHLDFYTKRA